MGLSMAIFLASLFQMYFRIFACISSLFIYIQDSFMYRAARDPKTAANVLVIFIENSKQSLQYTNDVIAAPRTC